MAFTDWLKRLFSIRRPGMAAQVTPGLHHALQEADGMYTRFHLRVERDGSGMLLANAMAAAQLTPSGVVIVKGLLEGKDEGTVLKSLTDRFRGATEDVMQADIQRVKALIAQIIAPGDTYPIFNLEDAAISPYEAQLIAPLQASLPLAAPSVLTPLIDKLWEAGIPHATFLVPANADPAHLIRAVERAEDLGMIAGARARAGDVQEEDLLAALVQAGLDHLTLPYASADAAVHDALFGAGDHAAAVDLFAWLETNEVCAVAEVPLTTATVGELDDTIAALMEMGADNLSFVAYVAQDEAQDGGQNGGHSGSSDDTLRAGGMPQVATMVEEAAHEFSARFMWNPPVERDPVYALAAQVQQGPRCAGDVAVRVEPTGDVIPPRGPYQSAGNLLHDPWERIWNNEIFRIYRERVESPTRCDVCPGLTICAADCPREPSGWARK
ncbi:MAG: radical SAM protein [Anaerolineae bacterium]|nr:radical SAM protein [Anaerolineae bacterium]